MKFRGVLNQTTFPRLWSLFQIAIGGAIDKRKLCALELGSSKSVLEIGCSTGLMAKAFLDRPGVSYVGLDINPVVIDLARRSYQGVTNSEFVCEDLLSFSRRGRKFDFVIFASVLHHVDNHMSQQMLAAATRLTTAAGKIVVVEPMLPEPGDPLFFRLYYLLEEGCFVRKSADFVKLLESVPEVKIVRGGFHTISATPLSLPKSNRHGVYVLSPAASS